MDLTAKLVQILAPVTGEGKNGTWKKQEIIVETEGQYPKKVCLSMWGDRINESILQEGAQVRLFFDPESREYNGRWFTELRIWKSELASASSSTPRSESQGPAVHNAPTIDSSNDTSGLADDLPF